MSDPKEFQGLAHLFEHMACFNSLIPNVDDKNKMFDDLFYTEGVNAETEDRFTQYSFQVNSTFLEDALHRVSNMIQKIPVDDDDVTKIGNEIAAVNTEFECSKHISSWKRESVYSKYLNDKQIFGTFMGNKESLTERTHDLLVKELKEFRKYYLNSDEKMHICIQAQNKNLKELEVCLKHQKELAHESCRQKRG